MPEQSTEQSQDIPTLEAAFIRIFEWVKAGEAISSLDGIPYRWKRGEWEATNVTTSPAGAFQDIKGPSVMAYFRPNRGGFGFGRRIDLRTSTTCATLLTAAALIDALKASTSQSLDSSDADENVQRDPKLEIGRLERTPKDYAIEFGEYLAKSTERLIVEINRSQQDGDNEIDRDIWGAAQSAIYEFRKRAGRTLAVGDAHD